VWNNKGKKLEWVHIQVQLLYGCAVDTPAFNHKTAA
jgi:hypothetical protein